MSFRIHIHTRLNEAYFSKDDVSSKIRVWFYYLNEKFGTDFPSKTP